MGNILEEKNIIIINNKNMNEIEMDEKEYIKEYMNKERDLTIKQRSKNRGAIFNNYLALYLIKHNVTFKVKSNTKLSKELLQFFTFDSIILPTGIEINLERYDNHLLFNQMIINSLNNKSFIFLDSTYLNLDLITKYNLFHINNSLSVFKKSTINFEVISNFN